MKFCHMVVPVLFAASLLLSSCAINQRVVSAPAGTVIATVFIQKNPKVLMKGLHEELENQVRAMGYETKTYLGERPKEAKHYIEYSANWKWDMAMYLTYFNATLFEDGRILGTAEYDARSGGANMGKFGATAEKIRPILRELFKDVKPAMPTATQVGYKQ